jgi:2-polyprenyl-3-methyl-5-hydroxy-6-metoxy-1,4-benzoquinol methylase
MADKIRLQYENLGVEGFYQTHGETYRNPHEKQIHVLLEQFVPLLDLSHTLDLACGSGEVSLKLMELGANISGIDPFTAQAYLQRTGLTAEKLSFEDIANGVLEHRQYSLIVCSFAMHLVTNSRLPTLIYQLANISPQLLILSPHKRPVLKSQWGFMIKTEKSFERVNGKLYRSVFFTEMNN